MSEGAGPYHEGERAAQRAAGEEGAARENAALIADAVMPGAAPFLRAQRMLVVASADARGRPWASVLFGDPGFVTSHDGGRVVTIERTTTYAGDGDVLWADLAVGAPLGLLAIELTTRRRLRVNGRVESLTAARLVLRVEQAYPNCPKYIQRRRLRAVTPRAGAASPPREGHLPDVALLAAVREADTIFVASGHPSRGLDASHRGGHPGFVEVLAPDVLRIADYAGNGMFNTLGNLLIDPRCGVTIVDFQGGRLHRMTGEATVHLDSREVADDEHDPAATGRYWDVRVRAWRSSDLAARVEWDFIDYSPYNP